MSPSDGSVFRLILGDCFSEIERLPDKSVDLAFADPPYFLSKDGFTVSSGKSVSVNKGDWDKLSGWKSSFDFHREWLRLIRPKLKDGGSIVVSGTYHSIFEIGVALNENSYRILNDIVWYKPNGAPNLSGRRLAASHESLIWASKDEKGKFTFNYEHLKNLDFPGDKIKNPGKQMRSVWWIPTAKASEKAFGKHPTQKPIELMTRIVLAFSNEGDIVLDPFMGSGTTGVAALSLNRKFIGIERDREFFALSKKRIGEEFDKRRFRRS